MIWKKRWNNFCFRLFGAFPAARRPLKIYSTFDCVARINTMISVDISFDFSLWCFVFPKISSLVLNLYNFTDSQVVDTILLAIGVPLTFIWLVIAIGMVRCKERETNRFALLFYLGSFGKSSVNGSLLHLIPFSIGFSHLYSLYRRFSFLFLFFDENDFIIRVSTITKIHRSHRQRTRQQQQRLR